MKQLAHVLLILGMGISLTNCGLMDRAPEKHADGREATVATLKAPNGRTDRFASTSDENRTKETKREIRKSLQVKFDRKAYLCANARETEWRTTRQVELKLELEDMVKALDRSEKPRRLTESQRFVLSKAQLCDPFLFDLRVISKLVKGYDLQKLETL